MFKTPEIDAELLSTGAEEESSWLVAMNEASAGHLTSAKPGSYRTTCTIATVKANPTAVIEAPTRNNGLSSKDAISDINLCAGVRQHHSTLYTSHREMGEGRVDARNIGVTLPWVLRSPTGNPGEEERRQRQEPDRAR